MILCDVGNTNAHILKDDKIYHESIKNFVNLSFNQKVYYINVNKNIHDFLNKQKNFINLENFINFKTNYKGLGIDRKFACFTINDGVVIDAGSAITLDIIKQGFHEGGFIFPGFYQLKKLYHDISKVLNFDINLSINLDILPQNTNDALIYGFLKQIEYIIKSNKNIIFTGGDAKLLYKIFNVGLVKENLIFEAMKKVIKEQSC